MGHDRPYPTATLRARSLEHDEQSLALRHVPGASRATMLLCGWLPRRWPLSFSTAERRSDSIMSTWTQLYITPDTTISLDVYLGTHVVRVDRLMVLFTDVAQARRLCAALRAAIACAESSAGAAKGEASSEEFAASLLRQLERPSSSASRFPPKKIRESSGVAERGAGQ